MKAASDQASAIFLAMSGLPTEARAAVLDEQCAGNPALRAEVEALLRGLGDDPEPFELPHRSHDSLSLTPGTTIGDFIVLREIGAGGTGVVYLAHQQHPPRVVALKVLRREFIASVVQRRFEAEAELLAQLHHPGIAQVFAAHPGTDDAPPFIAMELVNGPPITQYADARQLPVTDRVELIARVCDAVQHAHQRRVIHRDLKPGNILVGDDGQPKVLDFGVARRIDVAGFTTLGTETGQLVGTLAYMSPEQVWADPTEIDTRTDIHALGVILYRLLAGHLPFASGDPSLPELARRIVEEEPAKLGAIDPSLKGDIEVIAARAMAKEKERRYDSAAGLASDLRRYLAGRPISASADSAWYLLRRQAARYRLALGLGAAALAIVSALGLYAAFQRSRAERLNVEREQELTTSTIERGRLVSITGNHPVAEDLVWRELFKHPDSLHAQWTLWDIYSREPTRWTRLEHEGGTQTVRFSRDGRWVVSGGRVDGEVHVVGVESGEVAHRLTVEPRVAIRRAMFTPDGRAVVALSGDGAIRAWNAATGALLLEKRDPTNSIRDFTLANDGAYIATTGTRGVEVWSIADGNAVPELSHLTHHGSVIAADRSAQLFATGALDGNVTVFRLGDRAPLWRVQPGTGMILSLAISPDAATVVSSGVDGVIRFWDARSGEPVTSIRGENARIRSLAFDATGSALIAGGQWRTRIWNTAELSAPPRDIGRSEEITDLHITTDGGRLVTCNGGTGAVRIWDLQADARVGRWSAPQEGIIGFGFANAGRGLVVADRANLATVGVESGATERSHPIARASVTAVSDNGKWAVTVGPLLSDAVWDVTTGEKLAGFALARGSRAAMFADNDRQVVVGEGLGEIKRWPWADGRLGAMKSLGSGGSEVLALVSRDATLYSAHRDRLVVARDLDTGRELRRFPITYSPFSLALTPDGRSLAVGTYTGTIELWDVGSATRRLEMKGQTSLIHSVDVSPDGTLLASSSRDGTTRLWSLDGQFLATMAARSAAAVRVRFFPHGRRLAIAYNDGELEIRSIDYFFRYAAGQADYQLRLFRQAGESFPRAHEVLAWSRRILSGQ